VSHMERSDELLHKLEILNKSWTCFGFPILASVQYPQGLGPMVPSITHEALSKTTFSCWKDPDIQAALKAIPVQEWVLAGIEAHVCVFQTAIDMKQAGYRVIVLYDAVSSRTKRDKRCACGEMVTQGIRVTSTETLLFEILGDSCHPQFKTISALIK